MFKKTAAKSSDGAPAAASIRVKKGTSESAILQKLNNFKKVMHQEPKTEEDGWKSHTLKFDNNNGTSGTQDHYM
eukprot:gene9809-11458_t